MKKQDLENIARAMRHDIVRMTAQAGSGHPTSSLSAVELMVSLFFGGMFRADVKKPDAPNNDRFILSKGHAAPLLYALYGAAGVVTEKELLSYRSFSGGLEGHPTPRFPWSEAATGSLGQGLSVGVGMALNAKYLDCLPYRTFVLLGDSELAEGSVWEAAAVASFYKLNNLVAMVDCNRLGQRGPTMHGHNLEVYRRKFTAFGWNTITVDGHDLKQLSGAYERAADSALKPSVIIAKTIKGKGVGFLEDKNGFHGKSVSPEKLDEAFADIGPVNVRVTGGMAKPLPIQPAKIRVKKIRLPQEHRQAYSTRQAFGDALVALHPRFPRLVSLDAEVSNSTYSETFKKMYPDHFFEMFIAEQNMVGAAVGLAARGKIPFVSTFAAFFTRAFDQIRMAQYNGAKANIKFVGSHAGVAIGPDGPSQMALEDIAMFRSLNNSVVLYPADRVSAEKAVALAAAHPGIVYIRTTRQETPALYRKGESFVVGGSKVLRHSKRDNVTIVAAGITLHESLRAAEILAENGIAVRVIDAYSVKPIDAKTIRAAASQTAALVVVEDHYAAGGLADAVRGALDGTPVTLYSLAVTKTPRSGTPEQLLDYMGISSSAIVNFVVKKFHGRRTRN